MRVKHPLRGETRLIPYALATLKTVASLSTRAELLALREGWRAEGKTVVFTNGCYDLLHPGHIRLLEQARSLGDVLILALNSDASVRRMKGPSRPIIAASRSAPKWPLALEAVDAVTLFDEETPRELIAGPSAGRPGERRRLVALHRRPRRSGSRRWPSSSPWRWSPATRLLIL